MMSGCHNPVQMPICKHLAPANDCFRCRLQENHNEWLDSLDSDIVSNKREIKVAREIMEVYRERIAKLEERMATVDHVIRAAETAESLFATKVHELQSIDKKRDDVINALCQKIERLDRVTSELVTRYGSLQHQLSEIYRREQNGTTSRQWQCTS